MTKVYDRLNLESENPNALAEFVQHVGDFLYLHLDAMPSRLTPAVNAAVLYAKGRFKKPTQPVRSPNGYPSYKISGASPIYVPAVWVTFQEKFPTADLLASFVINTGNDATDPDFVDGTENPMASWIVPHSWGTYVPLIDSRAFSQMDARSCRLLYALDYGQSYIRQMTGLSLASYKAIIADLPSERPPVWDIFVNGGLAECNLACAWLLGGSSSEGSLSEGSLSEGGQ